MKEFLEKLLKSLNEIEVKGRHNIDIMLGCMMAVEDAIEQLTPQEEEDNNGG